MLYLFSLFYIKSGAKHKLQFLIGNNVLPYNMTVYQAVRQFSSISNEQSETDTDTEASIGMVLLIIIKRRELNLFCLI